MPKPEDDSESEGRDYDRDYRRGDHGPKYAPHENDPDEFHPPDDSDKLFGVFAHLGMVFFTILVPVIFYFVFVDKKPFITRHALEAINYRITTLIAAMVALLVAGLIGLLFGVIGQQAVVGAIAGYLAFIVIALPIGVANLVFIILACVAAGNGRDYRYRFCIRLF